jgi:hypothetical protein
MFARGLYFVFGRWHEVFKVGLQEGLQKKNQMALLVPANCKPCEWAIF